MNNEKQNILIAGANGTTGRIIVQLHSCPKRFRIYKIVLFRSV
jgi:hypothetical protein